MEKTSIFNEERCFKKTKDEWESDRSSGIPVTREKVRVGKLIKEQFLHIQFCKAGIITLNGVYEGAFLLYLLIFVIS